MLENFIISRIKAELPFVPNTEKDALFERLGCFLVSSTPRKCFLLKGYAGTGKTSVVSALVRAMEKLQQTCVLLAPTGRAAKVLAHYSGYPAFTIHKWIYRQDSATSDTFSLAENKFTHTLFIIDEASMISASDQRLTTSEIFGSGSLLTDLIRYVYSGEGCSMLLLGDDAQLPPVGSTTSKALEPDFLAGYGLVVSDFTLTQVARQALDSDILSNATALRTNLATHNYDYTIKAGTTLHILDHKDVLEQLENSYREAGPEQTLIVTRSNKRTNLYNQGVRARILWKEDAVSNGDRLMISKNNYFWTVEYDNLPFLANGDMVEIVRLRNERELYGYRFADASLRLIDYDYEVDAIIWIDTLFTDSPDKSYAMQRDLFAKIAEDYPEIRNKKELIKTIRANEYYNALQVRFAYAVTCHKAQGGQWENVFIDPGNTDFSQATDEEKRDFIRWLYTAITRATEHVFMLNFKTNEQTSA